MDLIFIHTLSGPMIYYFIYLYYSVTMKSNKYQLLYTILVIVVCLIIGYGIFYWFQTRSSEISPAMARRNVTKGAYDYIIDVRTDEEWNTHHLPTLHLPIGTLVTELPKRVKDKESSILFICKRGIRSSGAVQIAKKLGYNNVQAMMGNYNELAEISPK
jgi:rhodanese-related sulfurtransferase